jgi:hypothetical protein
MDRQMAFVLLERPVEPDMAALAQAIRRSHPDLPVEMPEVSAKADQRIASPMLNCAGHMVVVMSMPAPVPRDDTTARRASAMWPEAQATFDRHRAHIIVSTVGTGDHALPLARVITAVIGGVISAVPGCLAVVWNGRVAQPADRFLEASTAAFAAFPNFPFPLWIGIHPFRYDVGIVAVTDGLSSFVGREIEFEGGGLDPATVIHKVAGFAAYLVERGSVIPDGHTFGASQTERFTVHHTTSRRFSGLPVLLATAQAP